MLPQFPPVPPDPFHSHDATSARQTLDAILEWRSKWVDWFTTTEHDGIAEGLAQILLELLDAAQTSTFRAYPYHLERFPLDAVDEPDASIGLQRVLLWRAGIVDFLDDVMDLFDAPDFDIEECQLLSMLLMPEGDYEDLCPLCLSTVPDVRQAGGQHFTTCEVQIRWGRATG